MLSQAFENDPQAAACESETPSKESSVASNLTQLGTKERKSTDELWRELDEQQGKTRRLYQVIHPEERDKQQDEADSRFLKGGVVCREMLLACRNEMRSSSFHVFQALREDLSEHERRVHILKATAHAARAEYDLCEAFMFSVFLEIDEFHKRLGRYRYLLIDCIGQENAHLHGKVVEAREHFYSKRVGSKREYVDKSLDHITNMREYINACTSAICLEDLQVKIGRERLYRILRWLCVVVLPIISECL